MGKKIYICQHCGRQYVSKKENSKHCSRECRNAANRVTYNCDYCGKTIEVKKGIYKKLLSGERNNIYCSRECSNNGQRNSVWKACENCGKDYSVFKCFENTQKFCSRKCYYENQQKLRTTKVCPSCGTHYVAKHSNQKYCCVDCRDKSMQSRIECVCDQCGAPIKRKTSEIIRSKNHFCSLECKFEFIKSEEIGQVNAGLNKYMRGRLNSWRNRIIKENGNKCCLTGTREQLEVHHCRSFNLIIEETIAELEIEIRERIDDYAKDELKEFEETFMRIQEGYREYVCVNSDVHHLFHKIYGFGNNTIEQWNEFENKFKAGLLKESA